MPLKMQVLILRKLNKTQKMLEKNTLAKKSVSMAGRKVSYLERRFC